MTIEMIKVLIIVTFLIIGLLTRIFPYGVTAMIACVALVLTGVTNIPTAFSGLSSNTTVLVASMMVVASALGRTSIANKLRNVMNSLQGKSGILLVFSLIVITVLLSQLMGQVACLTIILLFLQTLDENSEITPSRMLFVMVVINCIWTSRIPVAMGGTMPFMINSFYEGMVEKDSLLKLTDIFKAGVVPSLLAILYCLIFYKFIPKSKIDNSQIQDLKEEKLFTQREEIITFIVFIIVTLGFAFQKKLGANITNIIPAAGVLALIVFKVLSVNEVVKTISSDIIWMIAGMQVMSNVLSKTGVGELIGTTVLKVLGNNPTPLMVITMFCIVTTIMTNFLSNLGTMSIMVPIAASAALVAKIPVQPVVLVVSISAWFAFVMPTGCSGAIIGFGVGNYNPFKLMKFTIPLLLIIMTSLIFSVKLIYKI